jgi:hypothetical protein
MSVPSSPTVLRTNSPRTLKMFCGRRNDSWIFTITKWIIVLGPAVYVLNELQQFTLLEEYNPDASLRGHPSPLSPPLPSPSGPGYLHRLCTAMKHDVQTRTSIAADLYSTARNSIMSHNPHPHYPEIYAEEESKYWGPQLPQVRIIATPM